MSEESPEETEIPLSDPSKWISPSNPQMDWEEIWSKHVNQKKAMKILLSLEKAKYDAHDFVLEKSVEKGADRYYFFETSKNRRQNLSFQLFHSCMLILIVFLLICVIAVKN